MPVKRNCNRCRTEHINCIYVIFDAYAISASNNFNMNIFIIRPYRLEVIILNEKYKISMI